MSAAIAGALSFVPTPEARALRGLGFWAHTLVFLGFAAYLPTTKHMHLVFAWPNLYFFRRKRYGLPPRIDFEKTEKFGIERVQELPWKSLLDSFACTECGRCNAVCPAHATGKPLMPMKVLHDVKLNLRDRPAPLVSQAEIDRARPGAVRSDGGYAEVDGQVHTDELWACTTCAACVQACPVLIDSVPGTLLGLRQNLVMMESSFPQEATNAFKGLETKGNPWGLGPDRRLEWAEGLDVPLMSEQGGREVEYLLWVGCAGATDPRARKTNQALVRILKAAGVDFATLGTEERCNGDPARRLGNEYVFAELAKENVETLKPYRFRKMLVTCPHCLNSLGKEYREHGGEYQVVHHSQLLSELLAAGRIPLDLAKGERGARDVPRSLLPGALQRHGRRAARRADAHRRQARRDGEQRQDRLLLRRRRRPHLPRGAHRQARQHRAHRAGARDRRLDGRRRLPVLHDDDDRRHESQGRRRQGQGQRPGRAGGGAAANEGLTNDLCPEGRRFGSRSR